MNKLYRFVYEDKVLFESKNEEKVDDFVDEWLEDNFDALYEFANGMLTKTSIEEHQTWFKAQYIEEVS